MLARVRYLYGMIIHPYVYFFSDLEAKSIILQNVTLEGQLWSVAEFGTDFNGCMSNLIINNKNAPFKQISDSFSGSCRASKLTR